MRFTHGGFLRGCGAPLGHTHQVTCTQKTICQHGGETSSHRLRWWSVAKKLTPEAEFHLCPCVCSTSQHSSHVLLPAGPLWHAGTPARIQTRGQCALLRYFPTFGLSPSDKCHYFSFRYLHRRQGPCPASACGSRRGTCGPSVRVVPGACAFIVKSSCSGLGLASAGAAVCCLLLSACLGY